MVVRMLRTWVPAAAVLIFGLAACTPEEVQTVIDDYAAHRTEQAREAAPPIIDVTADCATFTIHAEGWPDGSKIVSGTGSTDNQILTPVDGVADYSWPMWTSPAPEPAEMSWTVAGSGPSDTDATIELATVEHSGVVDGC